MTMLRCHAPAACRAAQTDENVTLQDRNSRTATPTIHSANDTCAHRCQRQWRVITLKRFEHHVFTLNNWCLFLEWQNDYELIWRWFPSNLTQHFSKTQHRLAYYQFHGVQVVPSWSRWGGCCAHFTIQSQNPSAWRERVRNRPKMDSNVTTPNTHIAYSVPQQNQP